MDLPNLYKTQISLTEWFEKINHPKSAQIKREDSDKRERLKVLNEVIDLPYDKPYQFPATEITQNTKKFQDFLNDHGSELCAIRLNPKSAELPKLRMRGLTIFKAIKWFQEQKIDPTMYNVDIVQHSEQATWSTIFIINSHGIFGEIITGGHHQLTQGFYGDNQPIQFYYDFKNWTLSQKNLKAKNHLKKIMSHAIVNSRNKQKLLSQKLSATFSKKYLHGYFETVESVEHGLHFIDYNQTLGNIYTDFIPQITKSSTTPKKLSGQTGSLGLVQGPAKIITVDKLVTETLQPGHILICDITTPDYVPFMTNAAAIVTERGGVLSHAAIISRELNKPCIVACASITTSVKTGDLIEVNATDGTVTILS